MEPFCIQDAESGAAARILVEFGFNCFDLQLVAGGRRVPVLWAAEHFASGQQRPSGSGLPVLFPFPGRIPGTEFNWRGRSFRLPADDGRGNAIHGFVHNRAWRVLERTAKRLVGGFQASIDAPELLEQWPADFQLTADYEIERDLLRCRYRVVNPDNRPLPFGLGLHPYFRVPLGGPRADDCLVSVPATREWQLVDMLPTGQQLPASRDLEQGIRFQEMQFDKVFTGLELQAAGGLASIRDPHAGHRLEIRFGAEFRELVVYNPPHREAVCIEPYTCLPGAIVYQPQGIDAGLLELPGGGQWSSEMSIRLS